MDQEKLVISQKKLKLLVGGLGVSLPTIVFLGTKDNLIPVTTAEEYKRLMENKGRRCDLHLYEGQPHGFFNYGRGDSYIKTVTEMDRCFSSLGYLKGQPTMDSSPVVGKGK